MLEKIREKLCEELDIDPSEVNPGTDLKEDLGADSLDLFEMVMAFEAEYDVEIPAEKLESIVTVQDVIDCLAEMGIE